MNYVLIGAGPAGVRAAETLREEDPQASITLVSGEPGEPYARMAIPYILNGAIDEAGARQRKAGDHYKSLGIRYLNNKAVQVHAGPDGGRVDLDDGSTSPTTACWWPPVPRPRCRRFPAPICPAW